MDYLNDKNIKNYNISKYLFDRLQNVFNCDENGVIIDDEMKRYINSNRGERTRLLNRKFMEKYRPDEDWFTFEELQHQVSFAWLNDNCEKIENNNFVYYKFDDESKYKLNNYSKLLVDKYRPGKDWFIRSELDEMGIKIGYELLKRKFITKKVNKYIYILKTKELLEYGEKSFREKYDLTYNVKCPDGYFKLDMSRKGVNLSTCNYISKYFEHLKIKTSVFFKKEDETDIYWYINATNRERDEYRRTHGLNKYKRHKMGKCYINTNKDKKFDSSFEAYYYFYLSDNNIKFQEQYPLQYKDDCGISHTYYCDFYLIDTKELIEIKGSCFLKDGKLINPFDKNDDCSSKQRCMECNNVKIISDKDIIFL